MDNNCSALRIKEAIVENNLQLNLGNLQSNISKYIPRLEPQWVYGLVNVEEAASFEFAILEDL